MELKITNEGKHISKTPEINERFSPDQKAKLAKASRDFESLLTSMMLKSMTKNTTGMFGEENLGGDVFQSMFENEISSMISKTKTLGVAEQLYKKITGEDLPSDVMKNVVSKLEKDPLFKAINEVNNDENDSAEQIEEEVKPVETKVNDNHPAIEPGKRSMHRLNKFEHIINEASKSYGVDKNIIKSVILAESAGNEKAHSAAKAKGLMQLMDSTARSMGVNNIWDPKENIFGGTKYLAGLLRQYNGNLKLALAAYNAGPGNVDRYNGVPPFSETKSYISRVMGYLNHLNG
ncbi:MAG: transglycosylase SLT domain-containing protein [Bacillota bacterium]